MSEDSLNLNNNDERNNKRSGKRNKYFKNNKRYNKDYPVCPFCGKDVKDITSAIAANDTDEPAHFDCVIKKIGSQEKLEKDEKVCYLGKGSFGVVKTRTSGDAKFFVKKRIQYEKEEKSFDWRTKISKKIKK